MVCLCGSPQITPPCSAALIWSDNFNDGNYAGWSVIDGTWSATSNALTSGTGLWHHIYYPSTVAYGEWRFDVWVTVDAGSIVSFIALDTSGVGSDIPEDGYQLEFSINGGYIRLYRMSGGSSSVAGIGYTWTTWPAYWEAIVTRDSSGEFNVYLNGTLRITTTQTEHTTSSYFIFCAVNPGLFIDNIEVYDEIITTDDTTGTGTGTGTTSPPPPIPGFPEIAILLGLFTATGTTIFYRRRQSHSKS